MSDILFFKYCQDYQKDCHFEFFYCKLTFGLYMLYVFISSVHNVPILHFQFCFPAMIKLCFWIVIVDVILKLFFLFCFPLIMKLIQFWLLELRRCTTYAQDKALMCLWCCLSLVKHIHNINGWIISIPVSMAHKIKRKDTTT